MNPPFTLTGNHVILCNNMTLRVGTLEAEQIIYNRIRVLRNELKDWEQLAHINEGAIEREMEKKLHEDDEVVVSSDC